MIKVLPPGAVELSHGTFQANVVPDVLDRRDLEYRPRLQPLPEVVDVRPDDKYVMQQEGSSCTGHALAAMINAVLASAHKDPVHVSPYMLYSLARRYDEFEGEEDIGSSLRGALKGWYYHGVLPENEWRVLDPTREPDIDDDSRLVRLAMRYPLGAFYRVNAFRLDDMQSAINELSGIVASAGIHEGWVKPTAVTRGDERMHVIEKPVGAGGLGGHAFAIVGYNEVGFLVQNSWGRDWGRQGFATLPYDDWLESAYDAWVARPGVPSVVSQRDHTKTVEVAGGTLAEGPGPDLARLSRHVVNLGNNGKLSRNGRFVSTPAQVHQIFERMKDWHQFWGDHPLDGAAAARRVVLFAHGGLTSESTGLLVAQRQLNWWLNNRVYPITFAWQTGPAETLLGQLTDLVRNKLPFGGVGFNLEEQGDRLVEMFARSNITWMWDEMKENAARASKPIVGSKTPVWPPESESDRQAMADLPGASLLVSRLKLYVEQTPADEPVEVHLVGHSAGSIFLAEILDRLDEAGIQVSSLIYLAAAIRTDTWMERVLPHLRKGRVASFASFGMNQARELDDVCGAGGVNVYKKSLLYLVSRALERSSRKNAEVPLAGMEHFLHTDVNGTTLAAALADGDLVWAPSSAPATSRSDSDTHGGFDDDSSTMTSVLLRVLGKNAVDEVTTFVPHTPLRGPEPPCREAVDRAGGRQPAPPTVDVKPAGTGPVSETGPPPRRGEQPKVPQAADIEPETRQAPELSSPIMEVLRREGWQQENPTS